MSRKLPALTQSPAVTEGLLQPEQPLPLLLQPETTGVDPVGWLKANRDAVEARLLRHGSVLLRGFAVPSLGTFEQSAEALCPDLFGEYGDLPREGANRYVYKSTPYRSDQPILFHNEASHTHCWPLKQWFFCVMPAQHGGRTPLVDCRAVYDQLDPCIREEFRRKQLMYVRNFVQGLDVSWQEFFKTNDRSTAEEHCRAAAMQFEWKDGGQLRTSRRCQAVARHPKTGEKVFFNQIQLHHVSCLPLATRKAMLSLFSEEDLPRNVYFGDGSKIDDEIVTKISEIYRRTAVSFNWQQGDILLVDNMLTAHGRDPFVGPRKIVVAMGEMVRSTDLPVLDSAVSE